MHLNIFRKSSLIYLIFMVYWCCVFSHWSRRHILICIFRFCQRPILQLRVRFLLRNIFINTLLIASNVFYVRIIIHSYLKHTAFCQLCRFQDINWETPPHDMACLKVLFPCVDWSFLLKLEILFICFPVIRILWNSTLRQFALNYLHKGNGCIWKSLFQRI